MYRFIILCLFFSSQLAFAQQSDTLQIQQTINRFFEGMKSADSTYIKTTITSTCSLRTVAVSKDGKVRLVDEQMSAFLTAVGTKKEGVIYDERLQGFDINIDGPMASAWTPYRFYVNEKFNHCGVNVFTLMKTTDGWKIIAIIDTRRKENCGNE